MQEIDERNREILKKFFVSLTKERTKISEAILKGRPTNYEEYKFYLGKYQQIEESLKLFRQVQEEGEE